MDDVADSIREATEYERERWYRRRGILSILFAAPLGLVAVLPFLDLPEALVPVAVLVPFLLIILTTRYLGTKEGWRAAFNPRLVDPASKERWVRIVILLSLVLVFLTASTLRHLAPTAQNSFLAVEVGAFALTIGLGAFFRRDAVGVVAGAAVLLLVVPALFGWLTGLLVLTLANTLFVVIRLAGGAFLLWAPRRWLLR